MASVRDVSGTSMTSWYAIAAESVRLKRETCTYSGVTSRKKIGGGAVASDDEFN